ncbi:hypothetical protein EP7_004658 [Isosphaeraceae bacterium EP7]
MADQKSSGQGGHEPFKPLFPSLPIITLGPGDLPPKKLTQAEKYGGLFYLGIGGLAVMVALLGWFGYRIWTTREVWQDVYVLNDPGRTEVDRVAAAGRLAVNPTVNDRQKWDIALDREVPARGRYLLAEGLTADAVSGDPRGYVLSVALSEGWPDWLRLLLLRPLALAADRRPRVPPEPLKTLADNADPVIGLWADYARAAGLDPKPEAVARLRRDAAAETPNRELAGFLLGALEASDNAGRRSKLADATAWVRGHHPGAVAVWSGSEVKPARELQPEGPETTAGRPQG